jgi:protein SCO1/2
MPISDPTPEARRTPRLLLAACLLAAAVFAGAGGFLAFELSQGPRGVARSWLGSAIGGPFRLVDQNGKTVTDTDLNGRWLLVYFGYTHCPDACPTALNNIAVAFRDLDPRQRGELRPVFITIDPARDTPRVIKDYLANFDAPFLGLTGTDAAIAQAAKEYRVYYEKHPEPGGDYSLDHTSLIYVMNPRGRFAASLDSEATPKQMTERLQQLLAAKG